MSFINIAMLINNNSESSNGEKSSATSTDNEQSVTSINKLNPTKEASSKVLLINQDDLQSSKISTTSNNLSTTNLSTLFCIFISLAVKYFRSTSYLWMFNEGNLYITSYSLHIIV